MTEDQFFLISRLLRLKAPAHAACHLHFFGGHTRADASRATGVLPQNVTRACKAVEALHAEIVETYS